MAFPQEIEHLIFRGFLTEKLRINNVSIVLKTINDNENDLIKQLSKDERDKTFYILAFSIFLFEGENVLISPRLKNIEQLYNWFKKLKLSFLRKFLEVVTKMNQKASRAMLDVQRFIYDDLSRIRWHSAKMISLNSSQYTGIEGTENLGLNIFQQLWYAFNHTEDLNEYGEIAWDMLKPLIKIQIRKQDASKLENSDKRRKQEAKEKRERILRGEKEEDAGVKTREGIVKELHKQLKGEKDSHDIFISQYEQQLKERAIQKDLVMEKLKKIRQEKFGEHEVISGIRVASDEEVSKAKTFKKSIDAETSSSEKQISLPVPKGRERFGQQMAVLDVQREEQIRNDFLNANPQLEEEVAKKMKEAEDEFFVESDSKLLSEEVINKQLLDIKPGTPEYQRLVESLRRKNILRLK